MKNKSNIKWKIAFVKPCTICLHIRHQTLTVENQWLTRLWLDSR